MKMTLLDYVQSILSSLSSDEVNSISDTTESLQVAEIVRTTYFNMITRAGIKEHDQLVQLDASLDTTKPVIMYLPDGVKKINWLKYFNESTTDGGYQYVTILPVQQFIEMTNSFNPSESNVESFTFTNDLNSYPGTFTFYYKTDKQPQYCAVISNYYVIFDGYDSSLETTLQNHKVMAEGSVIPVFTMSDTFIPDLSEDQVPLLLNEAKSLAFFELKQSAHPKAEQEAKRQWSALQRNKAVVDQPTAFDQLPNFGRPGTMYSSFFKRMGWDR